MTGKGGLIAIMVLLMVGWGWWFNHVSDWALWHIPVDMGVGFLIGYGGPKLDRRLSRWLRARDERR